MASGGPKKIGKYDVLDVIGRGGMGIIYKAVDPGIGRTVAIKMTTGSLGEDAELLKRFHREAQSLGKLRHPNIVTVYDLGVEEGSPYLVMELLEGDSLESLLRSRRSISLEEKLDIVIQICNGIQYAHKHNVIHRDIKPANIMLLKDGTAKILDFGIARLGAQKLTQSGQLGGSFQYMSPEQIKATNVDSRADIFSVGVLLFELVTGALPFEGKDTGAMRLKILHDPPPPLNGLMKHCPPGLEDIVQRSLAKNPEQRYQTAADLAFGLTNVLEKLRRERVSEYLQGAETAAAQRQWSRAKEQLLQVLKMDRQNARANVRLREVQAEFQKQQRSEQAKELQAQAEHAMAQSDLSGALAYLNEAVEMDRSNMEIVKLRDSIQENRTHGDKLQDLMQRAEFAQDAGDLEEARQAVEEGLELDPQNTDFRLMQAVIAQGVAGRDKQKRVQDFVGEARKEISSRRFTAALEVLRKAEALDSSAAVVQELLALASTGQQQEQRRQELERLMSQIEEALEKEDYAASSTKIKEGLARYPEDRGLLKLKVIVDKQREGTERRRYIEEQTAQARKLLDGGKATQAFALLQKALEKLPSEPSLHAMVVLVKQSIERTRKEREKAEIQSAREAIRRKAYSEAISILQAVRKKTPSSELDELLQFAQNEAENQVKRQKIDAVADEARQLTSQDKYPEAIALLKRTLQEIQDQKLQIILTDIERHAAKFSAGVEKAVATAGRLLRQDRYVEAIKFLEGQDAQYGKVPKFRETLEGVRRQQQAVHALSVFKEKVRDALSRGDIANAKLLWQEFRKSSNASDIALLEKEIEAKEAEAANTQLEVSLRATLEFRQKFEAVQTAARSAMARPCKEAPPPAGLPVSGVPAPADIDKETQLADPDHLQSRLGEVSLIAGNCRDDSKVQSAIQALTQQMTKRISILREENAQEPKSRIVVDGEKGSGKLLEPTATSLGFEVTPAAPAGQSIDAGAKHQPGATSAQPMESAPLESPEAAEVPPVKPLPTVSLDDKREQAVNECLANARELQAAGYLALASSRVREMLANYPRQHRLIQMLETLEREIESQRRQVRLNDLYELQRMEEQAGTLTEKTALQAFGERTRAIASKHPGDAKVLAASERVLERISKAKLRKQKEAARPTPQEVARTAMPAYSAPPVGAPRPRLPTMGSAATPVREPVSPPAPSPWVKPAGPIARVAVSTGKILQGVNLPDSTLLLSWLRGKPGKIVLAVLAVVVLMMIGFSFRGKKATKISSLPAGAFLLPVRVHSSPPGATIRVNNEVVGISDLQLDLPAGSYQVEAELNGYQSGKTLLDVKFGTLNSVDLKLQPALLVVKLSSDTGVGRVMFDDQPAVGLDGKRWALGDIAAGEHKLKFEGPQGSASFSFSASPGIPPAVTGPIVANRVVAVVVGNVGSQVHVYCSDPDAEGGLDEQPFAKLSQEGLNLPNVPAGAHALRINHAGDQYQMAIDVGQVPTLTTFLQSGKNIGTLIVVTHEDGVKVFVNGKPQKALTVGGELRIPNLVVKEYEITVGKPGFQEVAPQKIEIRKGEQSTITFSLAPVARFASLSIRGGLPGAQVLLDEKLVGTVLSDGTLSLTNIDPGDHVIGLRKDLFQAKRLQKRFLAGSETVITGAEAMLQTSIGEVRIMYSPLDAQVTLTKAGEPPIKVTSGGSLNLLAGTYMLMTRSTDHVTRTAVVEVVAGESKSINLPLAPDGMSKWDDPTGWKAEKNTYVHKGGEFVLYGASAASGTFSFAAMLEKGRSLQWVFLNNASPKNYVLFQMDENYFCRSTIRNGETTKEVKIAHKTQKKTFQTIQIRVAPSEIVHQVKDGDNWFVLDKWRSTGPNLASYRFGFYVPAKDQIAIMNFNYYADLDIR